jgi:hypothetical protein
VRCNLFHGEKSPLNETDHELVYLSFESLREFIDRSGCYRWHRPPLECGEVGLPVGMLGSGDERGRHHAARKGAGEDPRLRGGGSAAAPL